MKFKSTRTKIISKLLVSCLFVCFLISPITQYSQMDLIKMRGELRYGTRASLLSYFIVGEEIVGYEYQLLKAFCNENGLTLKTEVYPNNGEMFKDLQSGKIDVAGGHLSATKSRAKLFAFSAPISETATSLVTHYNYRKQTDIKDFEDTKGQLIANSSYEELLQKLDFQPQNIETIENISLFDLVRKINKQEIDFTFADSEIIDIYQYFIPGLYQPIQLSEKEDVVFILNRVRVDTLKAGLDQSILQANENGLLEKFKSDVMIHIPNIDIADTVTFFDKLQTTWPKVKDLIDSVATENDFDTALLAAISYQESHWNPDAVSISGVKGLMMLTESTAEEMNVSDRTDAKESLTGGIKYFRYMRDKIPDRITEPDKTLFALAAYNIGYGHLEDARILTQKAGKDPDQWKEVEPFLEKLNNPMLEHELNYGNANGKTAVLYVNNIMTYKQLMTWKLQKDVIKHQTAEIKP